MTWLWVLSRKPLLGKEDESQDMQNKSMYCGRKMSQAYSTKSIARWAARKEKYALKYRQLTVSPSDNFGTPRIGVDAEGTAWFRQYYECMRSGPHAQYWQQSFEQLLPTFQGECIPASALHSLPLNWRPGCLYDLSFEEQTTLHGALNINALRSAEALCMGGVQLLASICSRLRQYDNEFVGMPDGLVLGRWKSVHDLLHDDPAVVLPSQDSLLVTTMDESFRVCQWMQFWGLRGFSKTVEHFND